MFKKIEYLFLVLFSVFVLISCGGTSSDKVETTEYNRLAFDTAESNTRIPFPNDLMWKDTNGVVDLTAKAGDDLPKLALFTAIKTLNIKGFGPNTPIAIPLEKDIELSSDSLNKSIKIIDLSDNTSFMNVEIKQNGNLINIYPLEPMKTGTRYLVIITSDLEDYRGYPVMASVIYKTIRDIDNCSTLSSADLQGLCQAYLPLWDMAKKITGKQNKEDILEIFTFTTADKTLGIEDFGVINATLKNPLLIDNYTDLIKGYSYTDVKADNTSNEFIKIDSLSELPLLCSSYSNITDNKTYFKSPSLRELYQINSILASYDFPDNVSNYGDVCMKIFDNESLYDNVTIKTFGTGDGNIILFQHGLGKNKSDAELFYNYFDNDSVVVGMDLPWHGDRVVADDDNATACNESVSGSCYLTDNPIYDRLNLYQSLLDMHVLTKMFGLSALKQNKQLYFAGQSMGSITGSMLLNIDNVTSSNVALTIPGQKSNNFISKAVLNVGGGNYAAILNEATNSLIKNLIDSLGVKKHSIEYYTTLGIFQLLLDPADPAYLARNAAVSSKVILQSASHDTVVPNVPNKVLAYAYNIETSVAITANDNETNSIIANPKVGWYMFGEDDNWVNHGFLLNPSINDYPEAEKYLKQEYVDKIHGLAITQAKNFFK